MYGREYKGKELNFEPSGGLIHASLVMQDKETDTYWSIMTHEALAGELSGETLEEMPIGVKTQWKDWRKEHPKTKVLSIGGKEHVDRNPYENYFKSDKVFQDGKLEDERLAAKTPIYAFQHGGKGFAVPHEAFADGGVFDAGEDKVFLFRPKKSEIFYSTLAFTSSEGFEKRKGGWVDLATGARFDEKEGVFEGAEVSRLGGFDTFWFNWSMNNPETELLK